MVKKSLLHSSYLKTTHKLFHIKGHIVSAHLFEGNVPISHEWNAWILMNFVIGAKPNLPPPPHLTHTHLPCIQSGDPWPYSRGPCCSQINLCLCVEALGCHPGEAYQDLIVIGNRMEVVIKFWTWVSNTWVAGLMNWAARGHTQGNGDLSGFIHTVVPVVTMATDRENVPVHRVCVLNMCLYLNTCPSLP